MPSPSLPSPNTKPMLGYCTNVHAGTSLPQIQANLQTHAAAVKQRVSPDTPMPIGLWFAEESARALADSQAALLDFKAQLTQAGLRAYTLNGFPYADFHQPVVKHAVYQPNWADPARLQHTCRLAVVLAALLPDDAAEGSISTLPLGWRRNDDAKTLAASGERLRRLADALARLYEATGKWIHVDLEPEPGCWLDRAEHVAAFFDQQLPDERHRRYLGVCHDVCHSAVMFEPQAHAVSVYRNAGIRIGKAQISSALQVRFDALDASGRQRAVQQLQAFAEDRYLHQTSIRLDDGRTHFFEDLPLALRDHEPRGTWRVHFHVPLFAETLGLLQTTQPAVTDFLAACGPDLPGHLEAETYAWTVLPEPLMPDSLAEGIAEELKWVCHQLKGPDR